jgi:hypothetical protein
VLGLPLLTTGLGVAAERGPVPCAFDVSAAKGDGVTDDTAAIQRSLDAAAKTGGRVCLPPGKYLVRGSLAVPPGVFVEGALDSPQWAEPLIGSVILATGGRDHEDAPALFEMGSSSAVRGITIFYPEQKPEDIHPYAWTFHLRGTDNTVENVTLINSFNGIRIGPEENVRHRIRSVVGCVLRRGILVDSTTDIGRIENVQWHCHWWSSKKVGGDWNPVYAFMWQNLEGFIFGRTDWEYVTNTFVFPVKVGYHFIKTPAGMCNGQFCGIGADAAQRCVSVDYIQHMGLLITNGEFVAMHGDDRVQVVVEQTCEGSVRLVNCAFWGPARQCVVSHGQCFVSLSDCYLMISGKSSSTQLTPEALVEADGGKLQIRGCSFGSPQPSIVLKEGLQHAIISGNNGLHGVEIKNEIGGKALISDNEPYQAPE